MKEVSLQIAIVSTLQMTFPGLYFHHSPSGWFGGKDRKQIIREGAKLKASGTKPGFPDLLFLIPEMVEHGGYLSATGKTEVAFIEVKRPGNYLEPAQKDFRDMCQAMGIKWAICRSYEEVRDTLIGWGVPCKEVTNSL